MGDWLGAAAGEDAFLTVVTFDPQIYAQCYCRHLWRLEFTIIVSVAAICDSD